MRRPRRCVRLGAQRQQLEHEPLTLVASACAPWPYPVTLHRHYFNCVLCQSLPPRLRKPAEHGAGWVIEQTARRTWYHHLAASNVHGAPEAP